MQNLDPIFIKRLGGSGETCKKAILKKGMNLLGESMKANYLAMSEMLP